MAADSKTSKTLKQSFFKDYFLYKLRSLKAFNITFLIINFLVTVIFALVVLILNIEYKNYALNTSFNHYLYSEFSYYMMFLLLMVFIAENILIMIMAAVNMKFCHNRSIMDTIGGLPLTVSQRFFGDFLSGLASFAPTFFIGSVPALIMMAVIQFKISPDYQAAKLARGSSDIYLASPIEDKYVTAGLLVIITMFLCLAASYSIACFVTSCSGKLNNSIIFTFGLAVVLPLITVFYGGFIVSSSVGVVDDEYVSAIGALPPVGTIAHLIYMFHESLLDNYRIPAAGPGITAMLAVAILPAVGAYIISKKRKAEKVDKPFIYKPLYTAASVVLCVTASGFMLYLIDYPGFIIPLAIFTLAACFFIEFAESRSVKNFWKAVVRFAATAAVCVIFDLIVYNTNGFNIGKNLPNENGIKAVSFTGTYLSEHGLQYDAYYDPAIISAVLSKHKKIIDNIDDYPSMGTVSKWTLYNGVDRLHIEYYMKDGGEIQRTYFTVNSEMRDAINDFCDTMLAMPEVFNKTTLGVLNMPCTDIRYSYYNDDHRQETYAIKPSMQNELIECLRKDLLNRPKNSKLFSEGFPKYIYYSYINEVGLSKEEYIEIFDIDKNTLQFLSNSDNFSDKVSISVNDDAHYTVYYYADGINYDDEDKDYTMYIGFESDSPAKRALISYFETEYTTSSDSYSDKFRIKANGGALKVKKENEKAALSALTAVIKEQVSGGNIS